MTTVLVVDDSAIDRRLVGGLLSKASDWKIEYAADGARGTGARSRRCRT